MGFKLFEEHFKVARDIAAEGMVLLENDGTLPFKKGEPVAMLGKGCFNFVKGGEGSAEVYSAYVKSLTDGLEEKNASGDIALSEACKRLYPESDCYTAEMLNEISAQAKTAIITISRITGEAFDIKAEKGTYYLSDDETKLIAAVEECSGFEKIVIIMNIAGVMDLSWIKKYSKINAVLVAWQPGMEGGTATADVLCGTVNPSGKLTDTFVADYSDYPSADTFAESDAFVRYDDDIFVGYRYFETFAKDRVVYPFGYGLSYTEFAIENIIFSYTEDGVNVTADVENTGKVAGKQVLQVYISAPDKNLEKPAIELKAFEKTKLLQPGETQTLSMQFSLADMASFDDTDATGNVGCFVLESGIYTVYLGTSVRSINECGSIFIEEDTVTEQCGLKVTPSIDRRLSKSGEYLPQYVGIEPIEKLTASTNKPSSPVMLKDVANGNATMDEFVAQLTIEELIELSHSQPPAFARGTAGIGNLKKYGVPNAQTADGPLGLRKTTPTTAFPSGTLMACTWDKELQFAVGKCIGIEGISTKIDILLAPGLNIHRNPLCGRNFEYYSEDPVVAGKTAAAYVRGVQSTGMLATIKHFFANNKEVNRFYSDSLMSERAAREIYLRGFRIAINEGKPDCLMTSYNIVNGTRPDENYNVLTGILRNEWGYNGMIMTDWRVPSHQWKEIKAGNNVKMPYGYPEELALTAEMVQKGRVTRAELENNVKWVLSALMKTDRFKRQDLGNEYKVFANMPTVLSAIDFTGVSGTWVEIQECKDEGGGFNLGNCCKDFKGNDIEIMYDLIVEKDGDFDILARVATIHESSWLEVVIDGQIAATYDEPINTGDWQKWTTIKVGEVQLTAGFHKFHFCIHDDERDKGISVNWIRFERA